MRNAGNGITRKDSTPELDGQMRDVTTGAVLISHPPFDEGERPFPCGSMRYGRAKSASVSSALISSACTAARQLPSGRATQVGW